MSVTCCLRHVTRLLPVWTTTRQCKKVQRRVSHRNLTVCVLKVNQIRFHSNQTVFPPLASRPEPYSRNGYDFYRSGVVYSFSKYWNKLKTWMKCSWTVREWKMRKRRKTGGWGVGPSVKMKASPILRVKYSKAHRVESSSVCHTRTNTQRHTRSHGGGSLSRLYFTEDAVLSLNHQTLYGSSIILFNLFYLKG